MSWAISWSALEVRVGMICVSLGMCVHDYMCGAPRTQAVHMRRECKSVGSKATVNISNLSKGVRVAKCYG